jgi:pyruvate-formate lyase
MLTTYKMVLYTVYNSKRKRGENMIDKKTFPELRGIMAKYGMNNSKMGKLINNTYQTFGKKLDYESDFRLSEMVKIRDFFISKGEEITMETLFFTWMFTIVNKDAART